MHETDPLLSVAGAAAILECSIPGVRYLVSRGRLRCIWTEGPQPQRLFSKAHVLEVAAKRRETRRRGQCRLSFKDQTDGQLS